MNYSFRTLTIEHRDEYQSNDHDSPSSLLVSFLALFHRQYCVSEKVRFRSGTLFVLTSRCIALFRILTT